MAQLSVMVNGRSYRLSCEAGQEERLQKLAAFVSDRMKELTAEFGKVGDDRLMVMAMLMMADELFETRDRIAELAPEGPAEDRDEAAATSALPPAATTDDKIGGETDGEIGDQVPTDDDDTGGQEFPAQSDDIYDDKEPGSMDDLADDDGGGSAVDDAGGGKDDRVERPAKAPKAAKAAKAAVKDKPLELTDPTDAAVEDDAAASDLLEEDADYSPDEQAELAEGQFYRDEAKRKTAKG